MKGARFHKVPKRAFYFFLNPALGREQIKSMKNDSGTDYQSSYCDCAGLFKQEAVSAERFLVQVAL